MKSKNKIKFFCHNKKENLLIYFFNQHTYHLEQRFHLSYFYTFQYCFTITKK